MNDNRTGAIVAHGIAGLVAVVVPWWLGGSLGWPTPVLVVIILVLLGVVGLSASRTWAEGERRIDPFPQPPSRPAVVAPVPPASAVVGPLAIASEDDAYRFRFTATVHWQQRADDSPRDRNWRQARAQEALVDRAIGAAGTIAPRDHATAGHRLAAVLSEPVVVPGAGVLVWASDVGVDLPEEDSERLAKLERIRKDVGLWEQERAHEREIRRYLGDDVLASSGKALVWWLARHDEDIRGAVERIPDLTRISSVVQGHVGPVHVAGETLDHRELSGAGDPAAPLRDGTGHTAHTADGDAAYRPAERRAPVEAARDLLDGLFADEGDRARAARHLAMVVQRWGQQDLADVLSGYGDIPRDPDRAPAALGRPDDGVATSEP